MFAEKPPLENPPPPREELAAACCAIHCCWCAEAPLLAETAPN
jgi:hypothetical protein